MHRILLAAALAACTPAASPPPPTAPTPPTASSGPTCAQAADTIITVLHEDAEHGPPLHAVVERHCREDAWTPAARGCIAAAADHDGALACAYKHLTEEQHDSVVADMKALMPKPPDAPPGPLPDLEASGPTAGGGAQAAIAAQLDDEGKDLMYKAKYADASAKFRDAVARVPEPRYFFNLCMSLYQEGKFGEALTACNAAEKNNPAAALQAKITKLEDRIKAEARAQNIQLRQP